MGREKAICLVHGLGFPNRFLGIRHWGSLRKGLAKECEVHDLNSGAFVPLRSNVDTLRHQIKELARERDLIIVAHSKGCLEATLAVDDIVIADSISKMVLFNPALHGLKGAMNVISRHPDRKDPIYSIMDLLGRMMGDDQPDSYTSLLELTRNWIPEVERIEKDGGIEIVLVYEANEYRSLPLLYRISAGYLYGKDLKGDGEIEYSDTILNTSFKKVQLSKDGDIWIHDSITGLPFVSKPLKRRVEVIRELIRG